MTPCPWCGSVDINPDHRLPKPPTEERLQWFILCRGCGARGPTASEVHSEERAFSEDRAKEHAWRRWEALR